MRNNFIDRSAALRLASVLGTLLASGGVGCSAGGNGASGGTGGRASSGSGGAAAGAGGGDTVGSGGTRGDAGAAGAGSVARADGGPDSGAGGNGDSGAAGASGGAAGAGTGGASGTGGAGAGGSGTTGAGGSSDNSWIDDLLHPSGGMTLAVDSSGAINIAAAVSVQSGFSVVYGHCASQCGQLQSWTLVSLGVESDTSHVPSIALTASGHPRILYASELGASPGYHYVECDTGCDQVASWHDVRLTSGTPDPTVLPNPRIPFAVSHDGQAAFPYSDGSAMYLWLCSSGCGAGTAWTRVMPTAVSDVHPKSIAFGADDSIQLAASHSVNGQSSLAWFDCSGNCATASSWANLDGLAVTNGQFGGVLDATIARTAQGGTRILVRTSNITGASNQHAFGYFSCDSSCRDGASWKPAISPPISADDANLGFGFVLDKDDEPAIATLSDTMATYARCSGDCSGLSGQWQVVAGLTYNNLDSWFPPTAPASCTGASWLMYDGPDLALDAAGNPVFAVTAHAFGSGGDCGTGSSATTTDSFLYEYAH